MAKIAGTAISIAVVAAAVLVYQLDTFDPAPYSDQGDAPSLFVPKRNTQMLRGSEKIGCGQLTAPEDIAFDPKTGLIYTGSQDGWVSRVSPNGSAIDKWVNTGGRPLGIVHGLHDEVIVADAHKGLLNITRDGVVKLLTDEAEGLRFKLTDATDIGPDGIIYFTDASFRYGFEEHLLDLLEGRPNGRLLSYDPSTNQTKVLVKDLYFANGVALSADHSYVIFCETAMRRCKKYYLQGPKRGSVDIFIENLPGLPDNIRYDGEGQYWIALGMEANSWIIIQRHPFIRKMIAIMERYIGRRPRIEKNGGVIAVGLDGTPSAHYYDRDAFLITSCVKIGDFLYCGSLVFHYLLRLNLTQYPAA